MANSFPPDPSDRMIVEVAPGLFYQFSAGENCWIRVDGFNALGLATINADGLMSKEDLSKINGLLVPPPRIALTSDDCEFTFDVGTFGFRSSQDHLSIQHALELRSGSVTVDPQVWQIHENTFGYNFTVNVDSLIQEMQSRGNLSFRKSIGAQGDQGEKGNPGDDELDTGLQGVDGADGANSIFPGTLGRETSGDFEVVGESNRSIVDITVNKVSDNENFLVLTRANIGNIEACPAFIIPKDFDSQNVLVIDDNATRAQIRKDQINDDCKTTCFICSTLFHLDIQVIIDQVFARFTELVNDLKEVKETLANSWITTMITVFNEQRDAICCALESCESRNRNERTRQYIETARIQAAQSDFALVIDGEDDKTIIDLNAGKECVASGGQVVDGDPCVECQAEVTIDGKLNSGTQLNAVSTSLADGTYIAEIEQCCIQSRPSSWNGKLSLQFTNADGDAEVVTVPDFGNFPTDQLAQDAYLGLKFSFVHSGGDVLLWFQDSFPDDNTGSIVLCIKPSSCFEFATDAGGTVGAAVPGSCEMAASQVSWYERGWRTGAVCGAHVVAEGTEYIIAKRSIGIDLTCGGGESLNTPCISQFIDSGQGHPAIAFPTIDGDEFAGIPISGTQGFVEDTDLSDTILQKIADGDVIEIKGDAATEIPFILFPVLT